MILFLRDLNILNYIYAPDSSTRASYKDDKILKTKNIDLENNSGSDEAFLEEAKNHDTRFSLGIDVIMFFVMITLVGISFSVISNYLFIFLSKRVGADTAILGISTPFSIALEVPTFYFSEYVIKRFGIAKMIFTTHLLMILRVVLYMFMPSFVPNAYYMLPIELLHGISYALLWSAAVAYVQNRAPKGLGSTFQGVLSTLWSNMSSSIGAVLGVLKRANDAKF
ncbi:hypothetical protein ROZALSC1DRAFT_21628 [Rozella allomycis CSF55]|uniref:Major facilitator superfamily associated domain-containing protein n=1 Tax=Rozella allomycis (strain CSF55) TaxID=988480 RepID=A0A4P9YNG5_ROZAC|nr:hypothetical protein ROZALSC1DRAFT_21628 [Rozella allomycis CSF55]